MSMLTNVAFFTAPPGQGQALGQRNIYRASDSANS